MDVNGDQKKFGYQHSSKYFILCLREERNSYRFGTTWRWVNEDRIFMFELIIPFASTKMLNAECQIDIYIFLVIILSNQIISALQCWLFTSILIFIFSQNVHLSNACLVSAGIIHISAYYHNKTHIPISVCVCARVRACERACMCDQLIPPFLSISMYILHVLSVPSTDPKIRSKFQFSSLFLSALHPPIHLLIHLAKTV